MATEQWRRLSIVLSGIREAEARAGRRGRTKKRPRRRKKRSRISERATLPLDRVNYGTISSGRYISLRLCEPGGTALSLSVSLSLVPRLFLSALSRVLLLPAPILRLLRGGRDSFPLRVSGRRGGKGRETACERGLFRAWPKAEGKPTGRLVNHRRSRSLCPVSPFPCPFFRHFPSRRAVRHVPQVPGSPRVILAREECGSQARVLSSRRLRCAAKESRPTEASTIHH